MRKLILLLILCPVYFVTAAQQYIIRYDLAREDVKYMQVNKRGDSSAVPVIRLSQNQRVNLQLVNSANSYRREISYIEREETAERVIIPGLGSSPMTNAADGVLDLDTKKYVSSDIFRVNDNKDVGMKSENSEQKAAKAAFTKQLNDFYAAYAEWQAAQSFLRDCESLWGDLALLRYSTNHPEDEVRKIARDKTQKVFPGIGDNSSAIIVNASAVSTEEVIALVNDKYSTLAEIYDSFRELEIESGGATTLFNEAKKAVNLVNRKNMTENTQDDKTLFIRIADLYRQILNDNYTQVIPLDIKRRTMTAEIKFIPVIDSLTANSLGMKTTDTLKRWIPVLKKEPLRFRNTVGFSFVSFEENRWDYYVGQDSTISRESADQFQPVIVTYLHFYAPRDRGFRWGGSFGAGIPVGGDNSKLNLMMGLSTFLGRNDPICITVGASGAQVRKLSGLKLGDKVDASFLTSNNYSDVYRIGYFISLTFNPASLNTRD